jgi:hypothetical protein
VAQWREGTTGKKLEERDLNLKISSRGIKDFGDDRGYSPIDLAMAAKGCDLKGAVAWLDEKLNWSTGAPELDIEAMRANQAEGESVKPSFTGGTDSAAEPEQPDKPGGPEEKRRGGRIRLLPYDAPDRTKIPPRDWLYGFHYMRKVVSATIGPGGIGKSSLDLVEAVGMSIGQDLLGKERLRRPLRVWYHNGEDPRDEINRRIAAICIRYRIKEQDVCKNMFVTCGLDMPIKVATGATQVRLDKPLRMEIADTIREQKIDVAIFDPLVTLHSTNELLGVAMDPVIREVFGTIANETDCSIELAHHTRKKLGNQDEYTAADSRGSTTIVDAVRGMRVTNQMSKAEAEEFGIPAEEREDYFRVSRGKANMVRKKSPKWYRFETVTLPNGDEEGDIPPDEVGVLTLWDAPQQGSFLTEEDRAHFQVLVTSDPTYRADARAKKWIGGAIAQRLKLSLGTKLGKKRARRVLDLLVEEGIWTLKDGLDQEGHTRSFVVSGPVPAEGFGK